MTSAMTAGRTVANGGAMTALARFGLAARGFVYLVIGWLTLQIALGHHTQQANQRGALAEVSQHSFGRLLLWLMGIGFAAYAIWRLSQAAFGTAAEGSKAGPRFQSLVRGIVYAGFAVMTFSFIAGTSSQSQRQQQVTLTARVMRHSFGRTLVGVAGVVVIVVGLAMVIEGLTKKFEKQLQMHELSGTTKTVVLRLGQFGTVTRGLVFALAGFLVLDAAVTFDPAKSTGLDGALRTLVHQPFGPWLLGAAAIGLIAFGLYGLASVRYAKT
jgi:NADH:ubiquinone oxidoreductase subunit 6 (subunit J)